MFGEAVLHVTNGDNGDAHRTSAAIITLNGQVVASPERFNQQVPQFELSSTVAEQNSLSVEMRGQPGGILTISVVQQVTAEAAALVDPEGGTVTVADRESPLFGYKVVIPPGALPSSEVVSIARESGASGHYQTAKQELFALPIFRLSPDHIDFLQPVTIEIPYPDANGDGLFDETSLPITSGRAYYFDDPTSEWIPIESTVDPAARVIRVATNHFSKWDFWGGRWLNGAKVNYFVRDVPSNDSFDRSLFIAEIRAAFGQWSEAVGASVVSFAELDCRDSDGVIDPVCEDGADVVVQAKDICATWWLACRDVSLWPPSIEKVQTAAIAGRWGEPWGEWGHKWVVTFDTGAYYFATGPYNNYPEASRFTLPSGEKRKVLPFLRVALHECGHVMGLDFDSSPENIYGIGVFPNSGKPVMLYDYGTWRALTVLGSFDIDEVRKLYLLPPYARIIFPRVGAGGKPELWTISPDGSGLHALTDDAGHPVNGIRPSIFPDGKRILFERDYNLYVHDLKTGQTVPLTTGGGAGSYGYFSPSLSPDGTKVSFIYGLIVGSCGACQTMEVWMMDVDQYNGVSNKHPVTQNCYRDGGALFSPDGTKLLLTHYQWAPSPDCCNATDIYELDLSSGIERRVYGTSTYDWATDWTDAGILFLSSNPNWVTYRLYPGGDVKPLTGASTDARWAVFSPDRARIVYPANLTTGWTLVIANADGSNPQPIPNGGNVYSSDTAVTWGFIR